MSKHLQIKTLATTLFVMAAVAVFGENRDPVQTFYVPLPEAEVLQALSTIAGGNSNPQPSAPMYSYVSISIFMDDTVIYYDQH